MADGFLTLAIDDDLSARLAESAAEAGVSVEEFALGVLRAGGRWPDRYDWIDGVWFESDEGTDGKPWPQVKEEMTALLERLLAAKA